MSGGAIDTIGGFYGSVLNIDGGETRVIHVGQNSLLNMTGGQAIRLNASETSQIHLSGGSVVDKLDTYDASTAMISGGEPGQELYAREASTITILGSGFEVDGVPVSYGDLAAMTGTLTGTLRSGEPISTVFYQGGYVDGNLTTTGTITLVPEPTTALLLAIGLAGLAGLGRQRSRH